MAKDTQRQAMRIYEGCDVMQDELPRGDGPPTQVQLLRFRTLDVQPGRRQSKGMTPWVVFDVEMLEGLAKQLLEVAAMIRRIEGGEDVQSMDTGKGITVERLFDGPVN